jgi:hypothetical protein
LGGAHVGHVTRGRRPPQGIPNTFSERNVGFGAFEHVSNLIAGQQFSL